MMMASHIFVKILPNVPRSHLKRTCISAASLKRLQKSSVLHFPETDLPYGLPVVATVKQDSELLPVTKDFVPEVQFMPPKRKDPDKLDRELVDHRLQLLRKQLKCSEDDVSGIYDSAPRLCDLNLLDEVIRNIEILLHVYNLNEVVSLVKYRVTILTQIDNKTLLKLVCHRNQGIKTLTQRIDTIVKDVDTEPDPVASVLESAKQEPVLLTGGLSYSIMKEKIHYLFSEGISKDFVKEYSHILKFSMQRIKREIQYLKKELGEIDHAALTSRFGSAKKANKFRRSLNIATSLLQCSRSDFTPMQKDHLLQVYPVDVEGSIKYLRSLGFSAHDIRSCVYIIGQSREKIDKARHEILRNCDIDISNKKVYINTIQYQIKKSEGFGL